MRKTRKTYKLLLQLPKHDKNGRIIPIYDNEEYSFIRQGTSLLQKYIASNKQPYKKMGKRKCKKQKGGSFKSLYHKINGYGIAGRRLYNRGTRLYKAIKKIKEEGGKKKIFKKEDFYSFYL